MLLKFPREFIFGTSTSAYQIETAVGHDWQGITAMDGHVFERTTDHEMRHEEDVNIIKSLAPHYRMSLMWSKLQHAPLAPLDPQAVREYHSLFQRLKSHKVGIMLVLHHFGNPGWFSNNGGWERKQNVSLWIDYVRKVIDEFGHYVDLWNTFNEPNLYAGLGWVMGMFPPFRRNMAVANKVIRNISHAHDEAYTLLKTRFPERPVGISHNCAIFSARTFIGRIPAALFDLTLMEYSASLFKCVDFFGMSYYARLQFDPFPVTNIMTPDKVKAYGLEHDDMWEYYPSGLGECIRRYWRQYRLPVIITENGICTDDDTRRVTAIKDYMAEISKCIVEGIDVRGYYHWTAWDNFEWKLGPTWKFGLYECDPGTRERRRRPSADVYAKLAYTKELLI